MTTEERPPLWALAVVTLGCAGIVYGGFLTLIYLLDWAVSV